MTCACGLSSSARERVQELASQNSRFKAIDRAIGKNGLKVVTLLRLSPLLPLALSNYLYGLTSVDLGSYVLGSWAGMLPGTIAYVAAGTGLPSSFCSTPSCCVRGPGSVLPWVHAL
jgi:uncharacterized membrane protein YdjX (TVP38/TMEM64 family)